jgi:hypothetical protein
LSGSHSRFWPLTLPVASGKATVPSGRARRKLSSARKPGRRYGGKERLRGLRRGRSQPGIVSEPAQIRRRDHRNAARVAGAILTVSNVVDPSLRGCQSGVTRQQLAVLQVLHPPSCYMQQTSGQNGPKSAEKGHFRCGCHDKRVGHHPFSCTHVPSYIQSHACEDHSKSCEIQAGPAGTVQRSCDSFGSKADMTPSLSHSCFGPEGGQVRRRLTECAMCRCNAKSGYLQQTSLIDQLVRTQED